jgi:phosphoglucosamine mutase
MTVYPQVLLNVRVPETIDLAEVPSIAAAIARVESRLAGSGRLLVRYSGTEPLLRVMLEGKDRAQIRGWGDEIVSAVNDYFAAGRSGDATARSHS